MLVEELFQPSSIMTGLVTGVIGGFFALNTFFLKWLINSFHNLRNDIKQTFEQTKEIEESTREWLNHHEEKDQDRHEENLRRFEKISVALARLGSDNGTYEEKK